MKKKILIVDDEDLIREMIKDSLEAESYEVLDASSAQSAFQLVKKGNVACVISDIRMPDGDGLSLAREIFNLQQERPKIILITGYSEVREEEAKKVGVYKILQKPFLPETLIELLRKALNEV